MTIPVKRHQTITEYPTEGKAAVVNMMRVTFCYNQTDLYITFCLNNGTYTQIFTFFKGGGGS